MSTNSQPTNTDAQPGHAATPEDAHGVVADMWADKGGELTAEEKATAKKAREEALDAASADPVFRTASEAGLTVGLLALLLFLRVFAVARWNWSVAASLAESFNFDDAASIMLGTLFERPVVSGIVIVIALPLAIFRDYWLASGKFSKARTNGWFLIVALIATAYVLTRTLEHWWILSLSAVFTVVLLGASMLARQRGWSRSLARFGAHLGIAVGAILLVVASTVDTPWVERERVETQEQVLYGYVLEAQPGFLKFMTEDRQVLILPDSDVVSRTLMD